MEAYYHNQATMTHFLGHYRQRGSGLGALDTGIGRVALLLAREMNKPSTKWTGKNHLLKQHPN